MRYTVRYSTEDFTEKERFQTKHEAEEYYNKTLIKLGAYLTELELIEEE